MWFGQHSLIGMLKVTCECDKVISGAYGPELRILVKSGSIKQPHCATPVMIQAREQAGLLRRMHA